MNSPALKRWAIVSTNAKQIPVARSLNLLILYFLRLTFLMESVTTTISSKGQITVPVEIRRALVLRPGVKLKVRLKNSTFIVSKASKKSFFSQFRARCSPKAPWKSADLAMEKMRGRVPRGDVDAP